MILYMAYGSHVTSPKLDMQSSGIHSPKHHNKTLPDMNGNVYTLRVMQDRAASGFEFTVTGFRVSAFEGLGLIRICSDQKCCRYYAT